VLLSAILKTTPETSNAHGLGVAGSDESGVQEHFRVFFFDYKIGIVKTNRHEAANVNIRQRPPVLILFGTSYSNLPDLPSAYLRVNSVASLAVLLASPCDLALLKASRVSTPMSRTFSPLESWRVTLSITRVPKGLHGQPNAWHHKNCKHEQKDRCFFMTPLSGLVSILDSSGPVLFLIFNIWQDCPNRIDFRITKIGAIQGDPSENGTKDLDWPG
jgi:hypothetical protein